MQYLFSTLSETQVQSSKGGDEMLGAIRFNGERDQLITGRPGSGKTTVTMLRAMRFYKTKRLLVLTKHKMLVYTLRKLYPQLNIYGIDEWFKEKTGENLWRIKSAAEIKKLLTEKNLYDEEQLYDEILIDEGQDLASYIYECFPALGKRILVGADNAQRIYTDGASAADIERILNDQGRPIRPTDLQYNYRNFVETYKYARQFVPDMAAAHSPHIVNHTKGSGDLPKVIQVAQEFDRLVTILRDNSTSNVAIVLYQIQDISRYHTELTRRGIECSVYYNALDGYSKSATAHDLKSVLITTYKSVKGLEFQVVIMPAMERVQHERHMTDNMYYVACTRATQRLYLLYQGTTLPTCLDEPGVKKDTYQHIRLSDSIPPPPPTRPVLDNTDAPF